MKKGIACAGCWILDRVKIIDAWPKKGELANILDETPGSGGSPFNILVDFAHMGVPFPTYGIGCIGNDGPGGEILNILRRKRISSRFLTRLPGKWTGTTDVMTVKKTGERTFFHSRGANAFFSREHVPLDTLAGLNVKIFHLGYLLLLDALDAPDRVFGTRSARLLSRARKKGMETSVDVVSVSSHRYAMSVFPALPHVDHLIINEIEAGKISRIPIRHSRRQFDRKNLARAAQKLLDHGVQKTVVIHLPEGAWWQDRRGNALFSPSLKIPKKLVVGAAGAGDAFCAGILYALHENLPPGEALGMAAACAGLCLTAANTTDGVGSRREIRAFHDKYSALS